MLPKSACPMVLRGVMAPLRAAPRAVNVTRRASAAVGDRNQAMESLCLPLAHPTTDSAAPARVAVPPKNAIRE